MQKGNIYIMFFRILSIRKKIFQLRVITLIFTPAKKENNELPNITVGQETQLKPDSIDNPDISGAYLSH